MYFCCLYKLCLKHFPPLRRIERDMIKYVYWSSFKVSVNLVSLMKLEFSRQILEKILIYQISWKSVQWEPSCSMPTDGRRDITKLIVVFPLLRTRLKMFVGYCISSSCTFYMPIINDKRPCDQYYQYWGGEICLKLIWIKIRIKRTRF